jgi:hypothetical protein
MRPKLTVIDGNATSCIVEADSQMFGANDLSPVHREFLLSGMPVSEQESLFGSHEDEADDWDEEDPEN